MNEIYADLHIHIGRSENGKPIKITGARSLNFANIAKECFERKGIIVWIGNIKVHPFNSMCFIGRNRIVYITCHTATRRTQTYENQRKPHCYQKNTQESWHYIYVTLFTLSFLVFTHAVSSTTYDNNFKQKSNKNKQTRQSERTQKHKRHHNSSNTKHA